MYDQDVPSQPKPTQRTAKQPPMRVGISMGDFNGIGPELILRVMHDEGLFDFCTPVIYGGARALSVYRQELGLPQMLFNILDYADLPEGGRVYKTDRPNLITVWSDDGRDVEPEIGKQTREGGHYAFRALEAAVADLRAGQVDCLVTAPLSKENIHTDERRFTGHTEYIQEQCGAKDVLMLMAGGHLRVALATGHVPLWSVAERLTPSLLMTKLTILDAALRVDYAIERPRIAVLGLNPHAGDGGVIGFEERDVIMPAIEAAAESDIFAFGPYSADAFFAHGAYRKFDAVLAMYHDQGLIPFKTIEHGTGVNVTAGLPVVRTSPDHGPAFDIAGKGIAEVDSFRAAIHEAVHIVRRRQLMVELLANPVEKVHLRKDRGE